MDTTLTLRNLPDGPTKVAADFEALDYVFLSDDNPGLLRGVHHNGDTVVLDIRHLPTGNDLTIEVRADARFTIIPSDD